MQLNTKNTSHTIEAWFLCQQSMRIMKDALLDDEPARPVSQPNAPTPRPTPRAYHG